MSYKIFRALLKAIYRVLFRIEAKGIENIPAEGPVIIASNHISLLDPPAVGILIDRQVRFMAKEELFKIPVLGFLIRSFGAFPVKRGGVSKDAIKSAISLLRSGEVMGIFPEGTRSSGAAGAKKGTAMIAIRSEAIIIPTAIIGEYKPFRKMYVMYGKPVHIQPIIDEKPDDLLDAVTAEIMKDINALRQSKF